MELPIYEVQVDPKKGIIGMDFNSWVSNPAHESAYNFFDKQFYSVDEDKRNCYRCYDYRWKENLP